jgi:peptide/nickel transport system permease protein
LNYWVQRLTTSVALLLAVSALTFGAMNLLGDPLFNILGPAAADTKPESIAKVEAAKELYYLDRPLPERYVRWLGDMVTGDFGVQFGSTGQPPVSELVKERFPRSLTLLVMAQLLAAMIAIPWALISAARANKPADRISTVNSFLLIAMPNFALAVILKYVLGIKLGWFPLTFKATDPWLTRVYQTFLPALTIALPAAAVYQRLLRTDLITTLQEDFILMARSKGVGSRTSALQARTSALPVLVHHGLRHQHRHAHWRLVDRGEHLPDPRPRLSGCRGHLARGFPSGARHRDDHHHGLRAGERAR